VSLTRCHGPNDMSFNGCMNGVVLSVADEDLDTRRHERMFHMFNTVVFGSEKLTRSILPHFRERRDGLIVFNGSMWGWEGVTANSMYCGAKFALEGNIYDHILSLCRRI
jgi:NADP-dependent 3-hydroxy acid dehydrogenase YdfG